MKFAAAIGLVLSCESATADHARIGAECPDVPFGTPYQMTEADWRSVPAEVIGAREDSDLRDGVIDMTEPEEPTLYPGYTRDEFRNIISGETLAFSFDANADGKNEIYIEFEKITTCSNGVVQCRLLVLDASTPRRPFMDAPGHCLALGPGGVNGWRDIEVIGLDSDYAIRSHTYRFDGEHYTNPVTKILRPSPLEN